MAEGVNTGKPGGLKIGVSGVVAGTQPLSALRTTETTDFKFFSVLSVALSVFSGFLCPEP